MTIEKKLDTIINLPNTFIGEAPLDVDECQWIRPSAGRSTDHFSKQTFDRPTFSIGIRGMSNQEASARAKAVYDSLKSHTSNGCSIIIRNLPRFLGRDEKYRSVYTFQLEYQIGGY